MRQLRWAIAPLMAVSIAGITPSISAQAANSHYYVDCQATTNGDGSQGSPFNTLAPVNALTLGAGDQVLFKRGATCSGQLTVQASGTDTSPIIIGAYGTAAAQPRIDADGQTQAVLLKNSSHIVLQDLELTAVGDGNNSTRRGVYVYAVDAGTLQDVKVQGLYIHDVRGKLPDNTVHKAWGKFADASGGIVVEAAGSTTPTNFDHVEILNNRITGVDREGIYFWSNWCHRPETESGWYLWYCKAEWAPHTDITIAGNNLYDIGGDGIVPNTTDNVMVEHNKLVGFNRRGYSQNVGMWTANSENVTFQYNEVSGGSNGTLDGESYDVDHSTDGVTFQYNLSHDNAGGFFLFCPWKKNISNFVVRYNISVNDKDHGFKFCGNPDPNSGMGGGVSNGYIYNNTVAVDDGISMTLVAKADTTDQLDVHFFNNIIRKTGSGDVSWDTKATELDVRKNAFVADNGGTIQIPPNATQSITAPAGLSAPFTRNPLGYQLLKTSAVVGQGLTPKEVTTGTQDQLPPTVNGGKDYFGNPVAVDSSPNLGAYEGGGVCVPIVHRFDTESIGSTPAGWATAGSVSVVDRSTLVPSAESGRSVKLTGGAAQTQAVRSFTPSSGELRVSVRVRADQTDAPLGIHLLDATGGEVAKASLAASGRVAYTENGTWQEVGPSYRSDQWYALDIILRKDTYEVRFDGATVVAAAKLGPSTGPASQLRIRIPAGSSAPNFGVDDVMITRSC